MARPTATERPWLLIGFSVILFTLGYALADRFQLTHAVLYRAAANDYSSASINLIWLAGQALCLIAAIALLGRWLFAIVLVLASVSILVNLAYGQILNDIIDAGKLAWLLSETQQTGNALGEFSGPIALASAQTALAAGLFICARRVIRKSGWVPRHAKASASGLIVLLVPSLIAAPMGLFPVAAERNVYGELIKAAVAPPPPPRDPVQLTADTSHAPRHLVWLIDESIAHKPFKQIIEPQLAGLASINLGPAAALANCSAPANVALRSGVDVRRVGPQTDLRTTPSIWGYAKAAGYRTQFIDGQTTGAPQNLLLEPERKLIDQFESAAGDMDTDHAIASLLNRQLKAGGRSFTYAVLRGVHFQYRDHYPPGTVPQDSPKEMQYAAALRHSKSHFFERMLAGVNRDDVAIIYTSDHGQNFAPGAMPHCSREDRADEFRIPLVAFLPDRLSRSFGETNPGKTSASQIFPSTLVWMGYDEKTVSASYDNPLWHPTARFVIFGRNVVPVGADDAIEVTVSDAFPGTPAQ
ncbi:MAG: sulfatase-like hydrolase/transferase [Sphingomonadaceae bacterium]|nr:sulfatase-like hydrolase/transferase [Sphingomonadaceae bacterium]